MTRMTARLVLAACLGASATLSAPAFAQDETLAFENRDWTLRAATGRVEQVEGREALFLDRGRIWLEEAGFEDGVIELDLRMEEAIQGFAGLSFRAADAANFEDLYLRSHFSGQPDAVQYMPVINGNGAWQIHAAGEGWAAAPLRHGEWMRVRLVVEGDRADLFLDGELILHMDDLKADLGAGGIALRASGRQGFHFAGFSHRPLRPGEGVTGAAPEREAPPAGIVTRWSVSDPFPEAALDAAVDLPAGLVEGRDWTALDVETNGIANLSRAAVLGEEADTVLAGLVIDSETATSRLLRFGYSDRVRVYLNGRLLFAGDAGWSSRDYRFPGTVGRQDAVGLALQPGRNEILFAVSETFGGWAVTAELEDQSGLTIIQP